MRIAYDGATRNAERPEEALERAHQEVERVLRRLRLARVTEAQRVGDDRPEAALGEVGVVAAEVAPSARARAAAVKKEDRGAASGLVVVHAKAVTDLRELPLGDRSWVHRFSVAGARELRAKT